MNEDNFVINAGLLVVCVARAIRKEMFKNYQLTSDVISAHELTYTLDMAIMDALGDMIMQRPQEEIDAEWREKMEFVQAVTQRF